MKASINGHFKIVELLLRFGANPRIENKNGENALTLACAQENFTICEKLLVANAEVNHIDVNGRTPLIKAARHNSNSDIIQLLLKHGADPTISDKQKNTPLHFAALRGTKDVAIFLIKLGANPYAQNQAGTVPYEDVQKEEALPYFKVCAICKKPAVQMCKNCSLVGYCGLECQQKDWKNHQRLC